MTSSQKLQFPDFSSLKAPIEATATAFRQGASSPLRFLGQLSLRSPAEQPEGVLAPTREYAIESNLVSLGTEATGKLSIFQLSGSGNVNRSLAGWSFQGQVSASVFYRAIQIAVGFPDVDVDLYFAPEETFEGTLTMQLMEIPGEARLPAFRVSSGFINIHLREETRILGLLDMLKIDLAGQFFRAVLPSARERGVRRRIRLRPVRFRACEGDTEPSGATWIDQLTKAQEVWGGCCIELAGEDARQPVVGDLKFSEASINIAAAFKDFEADVIEVLFTAGKLAGGGGSTHQAGRGTDIVVISDIIAANNEFLLAHELGHVFRGEHPGVTSLERGFWKADTGTVLEDTSQSGGKNPRSNTRDNCLQACNPVLVETKEPCRFSFGG